MPSTLLSLHYHVVFSTKNREPLLFDSWRPQLLAYIIGSTKSLGAINGTAGGTADHVHLLVELKATHRLADFMRDLKRSTSKWVHETRGEPEFAWQEGYAAFTVSASARTSVRTYLQRQEDHHRQRSFRDELLILLRRSGVAFEEKYLD